MIAAPPVVLIIESALDSRAIARPERHCQLNQVDISLRPFEEILVLSTDIEQIAVELLPLRCRQREDIVVIGDSRTAGERNPPRRPLDLIVGVELVVEPERFQIIAGADLPASAQAERAAGMQLLVLRVAATEEVRVLPLIVECE